MKLHSEYFAGDCYLPQLFLDGVMKGDLVDYTILFLISRLMVRISSLRRIKVLMKVKCFVLSKSLINDIFFQTFSLNFKLFHKIIVLIWLWPSGKRKKFRVKPVEMLQFYSEGRVSSPTLTAASQPSTVASGGMPFAPVLWQPVAEDFHLSSKEMGA